MYYRNAFYMSFRCEYYKLGEQEIVQVKHVTKNKI